MSIVPQPRQLHRPLLRGAAVLLRLLLVLALSANLSSAIAANSAQQEDSYLLSTGAGVSDPSILNALRDNPAAVSLNQSIKLQTMGVWNTANLTPFTPSLNLILGTGIFGGQFGLDMTIPGATAVNLRSALGIHITPLKTAIGLSCTLGVGSAFTVSCPGLGLLFNSEGIVHVGIQMGFAGLNVGSFPVAAGISTTLFKVVTLSLDTATSIGGGTGGFRLLPALGLQIAMVQLTGGYGFDLLSGNQGPQSTVNTGITVGAGVMIAKKFHLMAHYNHSSWGLLSLAYRF